MGFFHVYLCLVVISSPLGLFLLPFDGRKLENENRCRAVCVAEIRKVIQHANDHGDGRDDDDGDSSDDDDGGGGSSGDDHIEGDHKSTL